jgi:ubiquitin-activating enzyme E1
LTPFKPTHLSYIIAAANLHAFNYGLKGDTDPALFRKVADAVIVPEFTPKSGVKVQINDNDPVPGQPSGSGMSLSTQYELKTQD